MNRTYYTLVGIALIALPMRAQQKQLSHAKDSTLNRTVVVEQAYNPNVQDAAKINLLPPVAEPVVSKREVEYAVAPAPAASIPANLMEAYLGKEVQATSHPGYLRMGYGSYGNLDLLGNYLFRLSPQDRLNLNLRMDGMGGTLDNLPYETATQWDAFYYRTRAQLDYQHQFQQMDLQVGGAFGLSNFNFKPESINGKQKFTSGALRVGLASVNEAAPIQFKAATNLLLYQRQRNLDFDQSPQETQLFTTADLSGRISEEQRVRIRFSMNNLFFQKNDFQNYTALGLNPAYEFKNDSWMVHAGANVDIALGYGTTFRFSPDLTAHYLFSDSYLLYAQATGGKQLNDFRQLESLSPYGEFAPTAQQGAAQLEDTYEEMNACLGFKASPYPGLWLNLFAGFQSLRELAYTDVARLERSPGDSISLLAFQQTHATNTYLGGAISYSYKKILALSAAATYRNWSADHVRALLLQPATEFTFQADVCPIAPLTLQLGYTYMGRKQVGNLEKLAPVSNLHVGATYSLYKSLSAYLRINNLLNKDYQHYLGYTTPGINFLGGFSFRF